MAEPGTAPVLPAYDGGCVTNVMAACLDPERAVGDWIPGVLRDAEQVVLLVIDGLGWEQLETRRHLAPTIAAMAGGAITTVAPSTTSTALTSIATGLPPGEHGVVGYRIAVDRDVLNVLRWATPRGDARETIVPAAFQPHEPFAGERPPVVTRAEFRDSGFTLAHLSGVRLVGYRTLGTLVSEVQRLTKGGEPFVYAYYEGLDKVAHEYGLGDAYDSELRWIDHLVAELLDALPAGVALVLTADHGQVDVGEQLVQLDRRVVSELAMQSGEGRFRWLHARPGRGDALLEAAESCHGGDAWVCSREQTIAEGWFGPRVSESAAARLGDVALVAKRPVAFVDTDDTGPYHLIARHGSLTGAEMYVPLLASRR